MFSYDKDIYKKLMQPVGLQYLVNSDSKKELKKYSPKNQKEYWTFLYPQEIVTLAGLSRPEAFSSISKGKFDKQYVPISYIDNLKLSLKGKNHYLKAIYDHLCRIIDDCAVIDTLIYVEKKSEKSLSVNREMIEQLQVYRFKEIDERKAALIKALSFIMGTLKEDILKDRRFNTEIINLIDELIDEEPIRLLGLLCTFALFPEDDNDFDFIEDIREQYINGIDIGVNFIKKETVQSHDLTSFINITKDSVLYRESEYCEIIDSISRNKGIVISGFGGTGKTSIARLVFSHLKSEYDYCGWINYNGDLKSSMIRDIELDEYSDGTMTENDIQKKWKYIIKMLANSKKSKIFVIDNVDYIEGVQSPMKDEELAALSGWDNIKVIITSRFPSITGYDTVIKIKNLGDNDDCSKCIKLFYYYNHDAEAYRDSNYHTVKQMCGLAGYNTMAIELLAKGSRYDADSLDNYYNNLLRVGFKYADEVPVETNHDFTHMDIRKEDGTIEHNYYDRGHETATSQLIKLFNMKQRSLVERQILWDFHCMPETERVSRKELSEWLGYSIIDINRLKEESWIKYEDGYFFMHPLINQAVACTEENWKKHWLYAEERRKKEKTPSIVSRIRMYEWFENKDDFAMAIRKTYFADYLSYEGRFLTPRELLYIADFARKKGVRDIGCKYYKISYDKLYHQACEMGCLDEGNRIEHLSDEQILIAKQFWKCTYYYGYMLSYTRSGLDEAEIYLRLASKVIQRIKDFLPTDERDKLQGMSFDHYGYVKSNNNKDTLNNFVNACMLYRLAIMYRKKLVEKYPDNLSYKRDLAWSLDNLGTLFAMVDYKKLIGTKGNDHDLCLCGEGRLFSYDNEYEFFMNSERKAEEYLKVALTMRDEIADKKGEFDSTEVAWTCCNLASLLTKYPDRYEDAEHFIENALRIYTELDKKFPNRHASSMARTYTSYGRLLAKWKGRRADALEAFKKALQINVLLEHDFPGVYTKEIEAIKKELIFMEKSLSY